MISGKKLKEKDVSVELLRILAAIIVIGVHVNQGFYYSNELKWMGVVISCFVGDGVAIFWMIMSFFLFNSSYKKLVRRTLTHVFFPMIMYTLLMFFFGEFLAGDVTDIGFGFHKPFADYVKLLTDGLLKWRSVTAYTGHFWYLYAYIIVVISFPILRAIIEFINNQNQKNIQLKVFFILFLLLLINDFGMNELLYLSHAPFQGAFGASIVIIFGYLIYQKKDLFEKKPGWAFLGLIGFHIINIIRTIFQYNISVHGGTNHLLYWYSTFGIMNTYSLIIFTFGMKNVLNNRRLKGIINHFGGLSYIVYFVHPLIIGRLNNSGLMRMITNQLERSESSKMILLVQAEKTVVTLLGSLILAESFCQIKKLLMHLTKCRKKLFI